METQNALCRLRFPVGLLDLLSLYHGCQEDAANGNTRQWVALFEGGWCHHGFVVSAISAYNGSVGQKKSPRSVMALQCAKSQGDMAATHSRRIMIKANNDGFAITVYDI